jgi:diguanylate cyclase (GGDEF)-like protein/PAS domain S-box-containing protein
MKPITPAIRISLSLVLLTLGLLLAASLVGLTPDGRTAALEAKKKFSETLAVQLTITAQRNDLGTAKTVLETLVQRNDDILSAALRGHDGSLLAQAGGHSVHWQPPAHGRSTPAHVQVPVYDGVSRWGTVEVRFADAGSTAAFGGMSITFLKLLAFIATVGFAAYLLLIRKVLRHLDPSAVIPGRVKAALDVLAEGVVLMDRNGSIVLANDSFSFKCGQRSGALLGRSLSQLAWEAGGSSEDLPWIQVARDGENRTGIPLTLRTSADDPHIFMVNCAAIRDDQGKCRGVLATFDDVTELEHKNRKLSEMLSLLQESRDEVHRQNERLQVLATRDPLTNCLNRRAFYEAFEAGFRTARETNGELACIMCDIDHFKEINDHYGHQVGDEAITAVANTLRSLVRESDSICRYGGEEFCLLLPGVTLEKAIEAAERFRIHIEILEMAGVRITASFGVSVIQSGTAGPEELLQQADEALYDAKRAGRNRVMVRGVDDLDSLSAG